VLDPLLGLLDALGILQIPDKPIDRRREVLFRRPRSRAIFGDG
jgi:hypothetical protein